MSLNIVNNTDGTTSINGRDTFDLKEVIKAAGGRWTAATQTWTVPAGRDLQPLKDAAAALPERRKAERAAARAQLAAMRAYAATPEGQAAAKAAAKEVIRRCLAEKAATGAYQWICCESCEVVDWQRQHTYCWDCGHDNGAWRDCFRVRGSIYTGD
uniref:Uncharacterized protein n=1 Tax=viral metagenome TaxID=1070528 RepID=A0A6C0DSB9_9ZZZZ